MSISMTTQPFTWQNQPQKRQTNAKTIHYDKQSVNFSPIWKKQQILPGYALSSSFELAQFLDMPVTSFELAPKMGKKWPNPANLWAISGKFGAIKANDDELSQMKILKMIV